MSISEQEQQALEAIGEGLARSAPKLASMLSIFSRLTAGETMPAREPARYPGPGAAASRRAGGGHLVRGVRRWAWLVAVLALIALALVLGHGTASGTCPPRAITCGQGPAPAHHGSGQPGGL
jgi:Protein of unknown function (DUF3040)